MELIWEAAKANENGVTSKKAQCGCEVLYGEPFVINACSPEHAAEIDETLKTSAFMQWLRETGQLPEGE